MTIYFRNVPSTLRNTVRSLATVVPASSRISSVVPSSSSSEPVAEHDGPLRPHLNIPVNPNHGLYGFFRVKTKTNSHSKPREDGQPEYVAVEPPNRLHSGRSWNASELRRKSFKDLHTLWYILLRERNLLATQAMERRRLKASPTADDPFIDKTTECQKSMARIKAVLTERRNAYIQAARLRRVLRRDPESLSRMKPANQAPEVENMLEEETETAKEKA